MNSVKWFLVLAALFFLCINPAQVKAQSSNLTGEISQQQILEHDRLFEIHMNRYEPDEEAVSYLQTFTDTVDLVVFMGGWCRESKKYLPGLLKTLEQVDSPYIKTKFIGVDEEKKIPQSFLKKFNIEYIPTVVVLKGNNETGRIEEKPQLLIESDLVRILKKARNND